MPGVGKHLIWYINPNDNRRLIKYYTETMKGAALLIFAGGGIIECSTNHDYFHHINLITSIAEKLKIPVCFNAVGKVIDPKHMFGWGIMKRALNRSCVKSITCRDGYEWINQKLFDGKDVARIGPCCAVYTDEAFDICRKTESKLVGIGVIRGNIFTSYGIDFDAERLLNLYMDIIRALNEKGYKCCVFTNGYSKDEEFADLLMQKIVGTNTVRLEHPMQAETLIKQISKLEGLITARLHSCIVAYSLQVPTVAISWTSKVADFMKLIGNADCAIEIDKLSAEHIIRQFEEEMARGYNISIYENLKDRVKEEITEMTKYML